MSYIEYNVFENQQEAEKHKAYLEGLGGRQVRPVEGPFSSIQLAECSAVRMCINIYDKSAPSLWVVISVGD